MHILISLILIFGLVFWLSRSFILNTIVNKSKAYGGSSVDITKESEIACYKCGAYYTGSPNFCPNCGVPLKED
jgi:rubrerythrin